MPRPSTSIRLRLALWYAGLLTLLLVGIGSAVYIAHSRAHYRQVDRTLAAITDHYRSEVERQVADDAPMDVTLARSIDVTGTDQIGTSVAVFDVAERLLFGRTFPEALSLLADVQDGEPHAAGTFRTIHTAAGRFRVHTMAIRDSDVIVGYVQTTDSLDDIDRSIARFRRLLGLAAVAGVVAATAGGVVIASRALRPIADMTETARAIALSKGFGRRLDHAQQEDELGELARTFNQMLASLEDAHLVQRRFVDDAAHELRAPLTSLLGNLEFLERAQDLPTVERHLVIADLRAEVERLARMVGELLTLARADAGQELKRQPVEFDRIVVEAVSEARQRAGGVDLGISGLAPVVIDGDADRLKQLAIILLDNALRYTPSGGRVRIGLQPDDDRRGAALTIADTGIGIAPGDIPRIFDRFYRADPARSRVTEGSGLGLSIARWICEAHGGSIAVESRVGVGSTFSVWLPSVIDTSERFG